MLENVTQLPSVGGCHVAQLHVPGVSTSSLNPHDGSLKCGDQAEQGDQGFFCEEDALKLEGVTGVVEEEGADFRET